MTSMARRGMRGGGGRASPEERKRRLMQLVEKFRSLGATSPEKAVTLEQLGVPPQFRERAFSRGPLARSGAVKEKAGKYYLSEDGLKELERMMAQQGA